MYLWSFWPGQEHIKLMVAKGSHTLQSIIMKVDPGSQIIAMSEAVCHNLALIYNPTIQLNMQSANGEIDQSLGLVRNVPCQIGTITLYLQMHVICDPAYHTLLGRLFEMVTESVVRNFRNEDQTITIKNPNNGTRKSNWWIILCVSKIKDLHG